MCEVIFVVGFKLGLVRRLGLGCIVWGGVFRVGRLFWRLV